MKVFFSPDPNTIGSKGLVFIGESLLVYRRDGNTTNHPHELDLPGGGPESQETPFETFRREVKEEFGLDLTEDNIVYVRRYVGTKDPEKNAYFPVAKLAAEFASQITLGDEGEEYLLLPPAEYVERDDAWRIFQERTKEFLEAQASGSTTASTENR